MSLPEPPHGSTGGRGTRVYKHPRIIYNQSVAVLAKAQSTKYTRYLHVSESLKERSLEHFPSAGCVCSLALISLIIAQY